MKKDINDQYVKEELILDRRTLLKIGGVGALTVMSAAALSACSPNSDGSTTTDNNTGNPTAPDATQSSSSLFTHSVNHGTGTLMSPETPPFLNPELEIDTVAITETIDVDVVIAGAGIAGVSALREAAEKGLTVAIFERTQGVQGRSGDFGALNAKCTERYDMGGQDTNAVISELMKESGYRANYSILKAWVENSGEALDWYFGALPEMTYLPEITSVAPEGSEYWIQPDRYPLPALWKGNAEEYYPCFQTTVRMFPDHVPCLQANFDIAEATGNVKKALFYSRVVKLLKDSTGRIVGVIAHDEQNDTYLQANAAKGVLLATGDYSGNPDILQYYNPGTEGIMAIYSGFDLAGNVTNTGDGQCLGLQVGAVMEGTPHGPMIHHMGSCMGTACFLQLNRLGKRFMNEDVPGQQIENQVEAQPGKYTYQFFDGGWKKQVPYLKPEHGAVCYVLEDGIINGGTVNSSLTNKDNFAYQEQIDAAVESGATLSADTLEDLLNLIGDEIDKATALKSIARYNELAKAGKDDDFEKMPSRMFALETPPFYASRLGTSAMLVCMGGLESDSDGRTFDADFNQIPSLYVAGNTQGGRFKIQYPTTIPGISHSVAMTGGRLAIRGIIKDNA
jgi:succinate dehydrogenase/fumarate reductase flavoprotein subunit